MSDTPTPTPTDAAAAPAKKARGKLIPILIAVMVLGGGGGGAYWYFVARPAAAAAAGTEAAEPPKPEPTGVVALMPFVVNLADPGGASFLRVSVALVVGNEEEAKEIGENAVVSSRIRSSVIDLLAQQTSDALVTPEGKAALKLAIKEHVAHVLHEVEIADVLFTEFVVQF
jgi:flagellar FliL protein